MLFSRKAFGFLAIVIILLAGACGQPSPNKAESKKVDCKAFSLTDVTRAAETGVVEAQNELGNRYEYGHCVSRDFEEAAKWYQLAADSGNINAQKVLGFMYAGGMGVPRDNVKALYWFKSAAESGHPEAQFGLAIAYFRGIGTPRNLLTAIDWFRKSADQDFDRSQYNLGRFYETGQGLEKDPVEAYKWYRLAMRNGYGKASKALAKLEKNMSPEAIENANQLVSKWRPVGVIEPWNEFSNPN